MTTEQLQTIQLIFYVVCPFTVSANFVVICIVVASKRLRRNSLALFQACLSIGDIVTGIAFLRGDSIAGTPSCAVVATFLEFFYNSDSCFTFIAALYCYLTVMYNSKVSEQYWEWYIFYAVGVPSCFTMSIFVLDATLHQQITGDATYDCWISSEFPKIRLVLYYPLLWFHFVGIIWMYSHIFWRLWTSERDFTSNVTNSSTINESRVHTCPRIVSSGHSAPTTQSGQRLSNPLDQVQSVDSGQAVVQSTTNLTITSKRRESLLMNPRAAGRLSLSRQRLITKTCILALGYIISWSPATACRVMETINIVVPYWLALVMGIGLAMSGFWNAFAFFVGFDFDYLRQL
jgi:hypothetical protein